PRQQFAVMLDLERGSVFAPVGADGAHAMRTYGDHAGYLRGAQCFDVSFGHLRRRQIVAQPARRIAGALFVAQHAKGNACMAQHARQRQNDLPPSWIVRAHAAQPEAVFLRAVERMIATGTNTVMTSSCGRLFDAVAALIGLRYEVNFEGQAAIELEAI